MRKHSLYKKAKRKTFGAGNAPGGPDGALTKVFANAIKSGMIIVNVTQCKTTAQTPGSG